MQVEEKNVGSVIALMKAVVLKDKSFHARIRNQDHQAATLKKPFPYIKQRIPLNETWQQKAWRCEKDYKGERLYKKEKDAFDKECKRLSEEKENLKKEREALFSQVESDLDELIGNGADLSERDKAEKTAFYIAKENGFTSLLNKLNTFNVNEIVFNATLQGHSIKEVFDFSRLERVSFALDDNGKTCAMCRDSFSILQDLPQLRKAFEEHARRGGKTEERAVFSNALKKLRKGPFSNGNV